MLVAIRIVCSADNCDLLQERLQHFLILCLPVQWSGWVCGSHCQGSHLSVVWYSPTLQTGPQHHDGWIQVCWSGWAEDLAVLSIVTQAQANLYVWPIASCSLFQCRTNRNTHTLQATIYIWGSSIWSTPTTTLWPTHLLHCSWRASMGRGRNHCKVSFNEK